MARFESLHLFSGGGGDLQAAEMIGGTAVLAANHWTCAVENSGANYPDVDHLIGDLAIADPRSLPRIVHQATVLCASPECDGWSLSRNYREEVSRLGPFDPKQGIGRSRATVWCPMRFATALPNLTTIIMEQVVDMVREASAFARYVAEWEELGWRVQAVCANSAIWGAAPQSRDRLYLLVTRKSIPKPDLDFRTAVPLPALRRGRVRHPNMEGEGPQAGDARRPGRQVRATHRPVLLQLPGLPGARAPDGRRAVHHPGRRRYRMGAARHPDRRSGRAAGARDDAPHRGGAAPLERPAPRSALAPERPHAGRARPDLDAVPTQTGRQDMALLAPPGGALQVTLRRNLDTAPVSDPWRTVCASGNHLGVLFADQQDGRPTELQAGLAGDAGAGRRSHLRAAGLRPRVEPRRALAGHQRDLGQGARRATRRVHPRGGRGVRSGQLRHRPRRARPGGDRAADGAAHRGGQYGISQQAVLRLPREAVIASYYGGSTVTADAASDPFRTQTAVDRHALIEPPPAGARPCRRDAPSETSLTFTAQPAPTRMPSENYGTLGPAGELPYRVEDAEFRMITPSECARVMGIHQRLIPQSRRHVRGSCPTACRATSATACDSPATA